MTVKLIKAVEQSGAWKKDRISRLQAKHFKS